MNNFLLSICIPTYNRSACLEQCLESLTSQFNDPDIAGQVEIAVSDNASNDSTGDVVKKFQNKFSNINYQKNDANIGYDRNALKVIGSAKGEFIWLLGDDDALFPDALAYILRLIKQGKFDYCIVNSWGYNKEMSAPALNRPNLAITSDQYFGSLAAFVGSLPQKDIVGYFGGMSQQIFKREIWLSLPDKEKFVGSNCIHYFVLLSAFKDGKFAVVAKPLVKGRSDNTRWEIFSGLKTASQRARTTQAALIWALDFYGLPYSRVKLQAQSYKTMANESIKNFLRGSVFKSQKSRDAVKKILGKL